MAAVNVSQILTHFHYLLSVALIKAVIKHSSQHQGKSTKTNKQTATSIKAYE